MQKRRLHTSHPTGGVLAGSILIIFTPRVSSPPIFSSIKTLLLKATIHHHDWRGGGEWVLAAG